jgi:hypothetical protein
MTLEMLVIKAQWIRIGQTDQPGDYQATGHFERATSFGADCAM